MLNDIKIKKHTSVRSQISSSLRDAILRKRIASGTRLPTTRELGKRWNTPLANVHTALSSLVKEGLLIRRQGVGTIVNSLERKLETIAVYLNQDLRNPTPVFQRLLLSNIEQILIFENIECRVIFENLEKNGFAYLKELAETHQIQGVIVPRTNRFQLPELEKLPIPFSCMTSARIKKRIAPTSGMFNKIVEAIRLQGGTKLAMINAQNDLAFPIESGELERHEYYIKLYAALKEAGIENRPEWNYIPDALDENLAKAKYTHFAYKAFNKIWENKEKPDCLFVYPDDLILGTVLAVTAHNIKVPDKLKLIMHRNSGNEVLCTLPCYFIEDNVNDMAQGLVQLIKDQFNGKTINEIAFNYNLVNYKP